MVLPRDLDAEATAFARSARSPATLRAYASDWRDYEAWCASKGVQPLGAHPVIIGQYLTALSGNAKVATLRRRLAAIAVKHKDAGLHLDAGHPMIANVLAGIRRAKGSRPQARRALMVDELVRIVKKLPTNTLQGIRDRALLLIGFAGAFRRSELVAVTCEEMHLSERGVAITIGRSKTDQEGAGEEIGIPRGKKGTCPVAALEAWLAAADIAAGPVFRGIEGDRVSAAALDPHGVNRIVKRAVALIGLDPALYGAHSLRSGFCTSAAEKGADLALIMGQSRHKSVSVARRYVQTGRLFANPASKAIGL